MIKLNDNAEDIVELEPVVRGPEGYPIIYFVQKEGIYSHGIYWIGFDYNEGIEAADEAAWNDIDDYHDWVLYRYDTTVVKDFEYFNILHPALYSANKND